MKGIRRPLCWVAAFYAAGIYFAPHVAITVALVGAIGAGASTLFFLGKRNAWVSLCICFFCVACIRMNVEMNIVPSLSDEKTQISGVVERVISIDEERGYSVVVLKDVICENDEMNPRGKIRLSLNMDGRQAPQADDTVQAVVAAYMPRGQRNPGGFDAYGYYRSQGITLMASTWNDWSSVPKEGFSPARTADALRAHLSSRIDALFTYTAPLIKGMVLGNKQDMPQEWSAGIRQSGLSHLLSVSGLHVGIIVWFISSILERLKVSLRVRTVALLVLMWAYCYLTGAAPGTQRACVMGSVSVFCRLCTDKYDLPSSFAFAFIVLAVINPWCMYNAGFVLSFVAVAGIVLTYNTLVRLLSRLPEKQAQAIAISVSAQLACLPFQVIYFGEVSVIGLLTNLVCVPLASLLVILSVCLLLIDLLFSPLALLIALFVRVMAGCLLYISQIAASFPWATLLVQTPPMYAVVMYYVCLFLVSPFVFLRARTKAIGISCAIAAVMLTSAITHEDKKLSYVQLDVGQGDCAVFFQSDGKAGVVDTGPTGNSELVSYLRHEGLTVDLLVLTHLDADHAGGLVKLAASGIPVRRIVLPAGIDAATVDPEVLRALEALAKGAELLGGVQKGDVIPWQGDWTLDVLWPDARAEGSNERSIVLRMCAQDVSILSTGDIPENHEVVRDVACDVLKVSHHGSKDGTSELFVSQAMPDYALISVGRNSYGHPNEQVMARLISHGAQILRTDQTGAITVTIDEGNIEVETFLHGE